VIRKYVSNLSGILYAAMTIAIVGRFFSGGLIALSIVVGTFMFLASLHSFVPLLSFTAVAFFGYATMFSVHEAGVTAFGVAALPGETLAAVVSMLIGACIGIGTDRFSTILGKATQIY